MNDKQKTMVGIGIGAASLVVAYRQLHKTPSTTTQPVAAGQLAPYTPQAPVIVQPGESIYDPNTTGLYNTPTAVPPQSTQPSKPGYVVNVNYPPNVTKHSHRRKPANRTRTKHHVKQHPQHHKPQQPRKPPVKLTHGHKKVSRAGGSHWGGGPNA